MLRTCSFVLAGLAMSLMSDIAIAQEKVILDSDYTTIGDDGQVGIMAAQLHAAGVIDLLGITVVAGNDWLPQEVADALKAVERLGIADTVGVYAGARYPLVHDYRNLAQEKALWGVGGSWYRRPEPADHELVAPLDGFATTAKLRQQHAVNFIIETVKKHPRDVTLLVIGPMTNITLHDLARDIAEVVEKLGNGRAVIVGHAYGNWVARMTAADHPKLVRGVVIAAAAAKQYAPELTTAVTAAGNLSLSDEERLRALRFAFFAPGNDPTVWLHGWHRTQYRRS